MDPVTTAIISALAAGATTGLVDAATAALPQAYAKLKGLIVGKFGTTSVAAEAMARLEQNPDSAGWREDLARDLTLRNAIEDEAIATAAAQVMEVLNSSEHGRSAVQTVTGNCNATASGGSIAKVNITVTR